MPEVNQHTFKYKEVIEALIKKANLHEGKWQIVMTFGLQTANVGPSAEGLVPGAALAVTAIGLHRATERSPEALVVDAAIVNPKA